ncbi:phytanoyl-CoA dioxygenase family protein [Streptomyces sp. NPDC126499]|uniref:phytanoyl-CoA dioxygenase family protein n=1 Tax=Streptomyces sp. NPDC126499 TaxID=3155314 RepID=UPI00331B9EF0
MANVTSAPPTADQKAAFDRDGFLFPVDVLSAGEAAELASQVENHIRESRLVGGIVSTFAAAPKVHVLQPWAERLVRDPRLLDIARSMLGPDLLVWSTNIFVKNPGEQVDYAWHQDALTYDLERGTRGGVRVWLALTDTGPENGTLRYAAGTHREGVFRHVRTAAESATRVGDEVDVDVTGCELHDVVLSAGQCSLHDMLVVHGSGGNSTERPRIAFAIDYLSTRVRPTGDLPDSAMLVSGQDDQGNFQLERGPLGRAPQDVLDEYRTAVARRMARLRTAEQAQARAGLLSIDAPA